MCADASVTSVVVPCGCCRDGFDGCYDKNNTRKSTPASDRFSQRFPLPSQIKELPVEPCSAPRASASSGETPCRMAQLQCHKNYTSVPPAAVYFTGAYLHRRSESPNKLGHHHEASADGNSLHRHHHNARRSPSPGKRSQDASSSSNGRHGHHSHHSHHSHRRRHAVGTTWQAEAVQDQALARGIEDAYRIFHKPSGPSHQQSHDVIDSQVANMDLEAKPDLVTAIIEKNRAEPPKHAMVLRLRDA